MLSSDGFPPLLGDDSLVRHVALVAKDHSLHVLEITRFFQCRRAGGVTMELEP